MGYMPYNFKTLALSRTQIKLTWEVTDSSEVIITSGKTNETLTLIDGQVYEVGDTIGGSDTIIYIGLPIEFIHEALDDDTWYYYHVWEIEDAAYSYSGCVSDSTKSKSGCDIIYDHQLFEDFSDGIDSCWEVVDYGLATPYGWISTTYTDPELGEIPVAAVVKDHADLITPQINCQGNDGVKLVFKQIFDAVGLYPASVQYSFDNGKTWSISRTWTGSVDNDTSTWCLSQTNGRPRVIYALKLFCSFC